MKKVFRSAFSFALLASTATLFVACGKDEECKGTACNDGGSTGGSPNVGGGGAGGAPEEEKYLECPSEPVVRKRPASETVQLCSSDETRRCLPESILDRKGVSYSGYRVDQDPRAKTYPSKEEILEDLELLVKGGYTLIRLFDSGVHGTRVLEVIDENDLDIVVQLGIWISGPKDTWDTENQAEISSGVALAKKYEKIVFGVSVGNEVLDDWSSVRTPPEDLVSYIESVRGQVTQPVATDDMYIPFKIGGIYKDVIKVVEAVDYLSVHVYAFIDAQWSWDWKKRSAKEGVERRDAMMDEAMKYTLSAFAGVRTEHAAKGLDRPLIIGEAGWKSVMTKDVEAAGEGFRAHPMNQKIFYDRLADWVYGADFTSEGPAALFYFEAFDEPWKGQDDGWGLFSVDRVPKYVVECEYPDETPKDAKKYYPSDGVYFIESK